MRFDVITLFPELFAPFVQAGITRRAYASGQIELKLWNPREHAEGNYRRVDDRPFGGGPGMVMMAEPLARCLAAVRVDRAEAPGAQAPVVLFSPTGEPLRHAGVIAALALLDAVARLQPGVLGEEGSHQQDSFNPALDGLLDCPHYTRPEVWREQPVPAPLLSGHHAHIERWRREQRLLLTARQRPALIDAARAAGRLDARDEQLLGKRPAAL